jgi:hypothetical protein
MEIGAGGAISVKGGFSDFAAGLGGETRTR